jgi:hypothetical protein
MRRLISETVIAPVPVRTGYVRWAGPQDGLNATVGVDSKAARLIISPSQLLSEWPQVRNSRAESEGDIDDPR